MLGDMLNFDEIELLISAGCYLDGNCVYYRGVPVADASMSYNQIINSINAESDNDTVY